MGWEPWEQHYVCSQTYSVSLTGALASLLYTTHFSNVSISNMCNNTGYALANDCFGVAGQLLL